MKTFKNKVFVCLFSITTLLLTSCSSDDSYGGGGEVVVDPPAVANFTVTNNGATSYVFNNDTLSDSDNPNITLERGKTYTFAVNTPGHPFLIKTVQSTGRENTFNDGVTNNGAVSGTVTFTVPADAPDTLFYNCEFHGTMTGRITISG